MQVRLRLCTVYYEEVARGGVRRCGRAHWGAGVGGFNALISAGVLSGIEPSIPEEFGSTP